MNQNIIRRTDVKVDMKRLGRVINTRATFNQRDVKTAVLICNLIMDTPLDMTDCTVTADILKPDGTKIVLLCQVLDPLKGVIAIGLTNQCLTVIGDVQFELTIRTETQTLYSPVLLYTVVDNLFDLDNEVITSEDEYPILTQLIAEIQIIEKALYNLELLIQSTEEDRNNNEEIRKANEIERQAYIIGLKLEFDQMVSTFNTKVALVDSEISRINSVVDNKITEVNNTVNSKVTEINNTITNVNNILDNKINIVDGRVALVNTKLAAMDKSMSDMTNLTNAKISEMTKIINDNVDFVNNKCDEMDITISVTNTLIENVEEAEDYRNNAEVIRQTEHDALIAELTVLPGDIDDIIGMIGGL